MDSASNPVLTQDAYSALIEVVHASYADLDPVHQWINLDHQYILINVN